MTIRLYTNKYNGKLYDMLAQIKVESTFLINFQWEAGKIMQ